MDEMWNSLIACTILLFICTGHIIKRKEQTCLPRQMHVLILCLWIFNTETTCWRVDFGSVLFQFVGTMNINAQSLMVATLAKSLKNLGYEVEVSCFAKMVIE